MNNVPVILDDQRPIIEWAREMKKGFIHMNSIISLLTSDKPWKTNDKIEEMRKIYKGKNNAWQDQVLYALIMDSYRLQTDIREGWIVTDGDLVGYATQIDYKTREFELFCSKIYAGRHRLGRFLMDDFRRLETK
jgi:predicted GTPase